MEGDFKVETYRAITGSLEDALVCVTKAQSAASVGFGPLDARTQELVDTYAAVYGALIRFRMPTPPPR